VLVKNFILILLCLNINSCNANNAAKNHLARKQADDFIIWKDNLYQKALQKNYEKKFLTKVFSVIKLSSAVIIQDKKQFKPQSFNQYYKNAVNNLRIKLAKQNIKKHQILLEEISHKYQVPTSYIVALWAVETSFGKMMGNYNIVNSLANLAYEGRRRKFFEKEFFAALEIMQKNNIAIKDFKGSWAGAMGQCQFMPTTYLSYGVDYNQDNRIDIWNDRADIFASIANYLKQYRWNMSLPWGYEIKPFKVKKRLNKNYYKLDGLIKKYQLVRLNNKEFPKELLHSQVKIINYQDRYFVVFKNFAVIKKWNNSNYFALTIGLLANQIEVN
jgi:membrane-bound lytic murein transglycosylase B